MTAMHRILHAAVAIAALSLAACQTDSTLAPFKNGPEAEFSAAKRFPALIEPRMMTLRVPTDGTPASIDSAAETQIARFAADYLDHGSGAIAVSAPVRFRDAPNDVAARLVDLGVPQDRILIGNQDESGPNDSVKLTYIRYVAETPRCGDWSRSLTFTADNHVSPNFGCATQHNLAVMVADPRDLVSPRPLTPDDALRRLEVLDKYRKGQTTVAERTEAQSGAVSTVGGK